MVWVLWYSMNGRVHGNKRQVIPYKGFRKHRKKAPGQSLWNLNAPHRGRRHKARIESKMCIPCMGIHQNLEADAWWIFQNLLKRDPKESYAADWSKYESCIHLPSKTFVLLLHCISKGYLPNVQNWVSHTCSLHQNVKQKQFAMLLEYAIGVGRLVELGQRRKKSNWPGWCIVVLGRER